jgi:hypothetical protein
MPSIKQSVYFNYYGAELIETGGGCQGGGIGCSVFWQPLNVVVPI